MRYFLAVVNFSDSVYFAGVGELLTVAVQRLASV